MGGVVMNATTLWVLVFLSSGYNGNVASFVEFTSRERCEAAVAFIRDHANRYGTRVACLPR